MRWLVFALLLSSHAPVAMAQDSRTWSHHELYQKAYDGLLTAPDLDRAFEVSQSRCKIEAMKVSVPAPSCVQRQVEGCFGLSGMALGRCQALQDSQRSLGQLACDNSAASAAYEAQDAIFENCMVVEGWTRRPFVPARSPDPHPDAAFAEALARTIPDWEALDREPGWDAFLKGADPLTGKLRGSILNDLVQQRDAEAVAAMMRQYRSTQAQGAQ